MWRGTAHTDSSGLTLTERLHFDFIWDGCENAVRRVKLFRVPPLSCVVAQFWGAVLMHGNGDARSGDTGFDDRQLQQIADEFQKALASGEAPQIEEFVARIPDEAAQERLRQKLLELERSFADTKSASDTQKWWLSGGQHGSDEEIPETQSIGLSVALLAGAIFSAI